MVPWISNRRKSFSNWWKCPKIISEENKNNVRQMFSEEITLSLRNAAFEIRINHTIISIFLRGNVKLFPWKLQMHQQINDEDRVKATHTAQYCRNKLRGDSQFLKKLFSDECKFSLLGEVNRTELSDMAFRTSTTRNRSPAQLSLGYDLVRPTEKWIKWTLFLWKWKRYRTGLEKNGSILCVSMTSKQYGRHDV